MIRMADTTTLKLIELLMQSKTPYIRLNIEINDGKKCETSILKGTPKGWKNWTYEECMEYNKTRTSCKHLQVNLSKSPYMVIDNDEVSVDYDFRKTFCNEWVTSSVSKGLCHVWLKKDVNDGSKDLTDAYSKNKEVLETCPYFVKTDLRYSNIFERADAVIKTTPEMTVFQFEAEHPYAIRKNQTAEIRTEKTEKTYANTDVDVEQMIELGLLDDKINSYSDWFDVLCAFKRAGLPYELFCTLSKRATTSYDENKNLDIWEQTDVSNPAGYNMGSIIKWCKAKDEDLYKETFGWVIPFSVTEKGAYAIAERTYKKMKNLVFCNERWYKYNEGLKIWQVWKEPTAYVVSILMRFIDATVAFRANLILKEQNEDKKEWLRENSGHSYYKYWVENKFSSQFLKFLKEKLYDRDFENKLDNLKYKMAFRNGMYDIKSDTFREGLQYDDFLTDFIDRDYYTDVDEEREAFIMKVFYHICNSDTEQADYYKSVLGYSLCGDAEKEKDIYFLIGQGANNGKTTILEAMKDAIPSVVGSINNQALLNNYAKSHKFLPVLGQKKIVYVEELLKGKELNTGLLKEIRDGKSLSNEVMYGTSKQINVSSKMFILSNHLPVFKTDNGISTCLRQIQMNTKFCTENNPEYHKVGVVPGYMKADKTLADKLRGDYLIPLLQHLLKYARMYVADGKLKPIPKFFLEKARETCMANDEMQTFWDEEIVEKPEYKLTKAEVEHHFRKLDIKEVQSYFKSRGYEYDKTMRNGDWKRGGWRGITLSQLLEENENDE
jgi:phage/plasmid-associated DNA primase